MVANIIKKRIKDLDSQTLSSTIVEAQEIERSASVDECLRKFSKAIKQKGSGSYLIIAVKL